MTKYYDDNADRIMLAQFGESWSKVKRAIALELESNKCKARYNPVWFVLTERKTGVPANDIKSIIDYGLQREIFRFCNRDRNTFVYC